MMSKQSLINIAKSNANYSIKQGLQDTQAMVLVVVGGKERSIMKKSAEELHRTIKASKLHIASGMKHGELSICKPICYFDLFMGLVSKSDTKATEDL